MLLQPEERERDKGKVSPPTAFPRRGRKGTPGFKGSPKTGTKEKGAGNSCGVGQSIVTVKVTVYGAPIMCTWYVLEASPTRSCSVAAVHCVMLADGEAGVERAGCGQNNNNSN